MTTLRVMLSYANKRNRFKNPVWLVGGVPGTLTRPLFFRRLALAVRRTKAPNRFKTLRAASSVRLVTRLGVSLNFNVKAIATPVVGTSQSTRL